MSRRRIAPNAIDRAIGWLAPELGLRRMRARAALSVASGYIGARRDRPATMTWRTSGASGDAATLLDLPTLRGRSYDLVRNDPIARSAVSTKVTNVIGTGHVVRPEIDGERLGLTAEAKRSWERDASAIWSEWAESRDCDITRRQTFAELEDLVYRAALQSGDVLAVFRDRSRPGRSLSMCLQMIEADRLSNPDRARDTATLAGGIELDRDGAAKAYHIANRHDFDRDQGSIRWRKVPAYDRTGRPLVLHIGGTRERPDLTRYAPMLAPVIESLRQRSRYTEAELMAAVVSACFAIGMQSESGDLAEGLEKTGGNPASDLTEQLTSPGTIVDLLPGEQVIPFAPGRPNPDFEPFVTAISQEVGAGLDLPVELLLKSFKASYSASRAAMEMAWQGFRTERARHVKQFCAPVYADVMGEAVARGLLTAPGFFDDPLIRRAWLGAVWMGPARPTLDPVKDAQADRQYLDMGVTTRTRIAAERHGADWEQVQARLDEEAAARLGGGDTAASDGAAPDPASPDPEAPHDSTDSDLET